MTDEQMIKMAYLEALAEESRIRREIKQNKDKLEAASTQRIMLFNEWRSASQRSAACVEMANRNHQDMCAGNTTTLEPLVFSGDHLRTIGACLSYAVESGEIPDYIDRFRVEHILGMINDCLSHFYR